MSLTHSQTPFKFSFQSVTFPSPQLTASRFPARLHDTLQTTSGNLPVGAGAPEGETIVLDGSSAAFTQGDEGVSFVQINTVLSWDAVAMYDRGKPMLGAQATSRTQSVCPSSVSSSTHDCCSSLYPQILTRLSHPALAKRLMALNCAGPWPGAEDCGVMREPGRTAGAQDTALHPIA